MDLWRFDRVKNEHKRLVLAADLNAVADESVTELSDAERAERERKRQFTFGISHYQWLGNAGSLAVYADGQAYLLDTAAGGSGPHRITPEDLRHSGFNPSPSGALMSYVRQGNLFYQSSIRHLTRLWSPKTATNTSAMAFPIFWLLKKCIASRALGGLPANDI